MRAQCDREIEEGCAGALREGTGKGGGRPWQLWHGGKKGRKDETQLQGVVRNSLSLELKYQTTRGSTGEQELSSDFHDSKKIFQGESKEGTS